METITFSFTHYDYFWLTGANRNQQLLRFASLITIGIISAFLIPIFHTFGFFFLCRTSSCFRIWIRH
ncbi:DUF4018 domain-containing protein [Bacillus thuringiensis]|uniref:DUF4018 domain-containing protein n=1 Tax=Bacillus thuringiensis TaxID=1428 RepID=UPI0034A049E5